MWSVYLVCLWMSSKLFMQKGDDENNDFKLIDKKVFILPGFSSAASLGNIITSTPMSLPVR